MTQNKRGLLQRIEEDGAVICAEGFLFELEKRGFCSAGEFVPEVALEYPQALRNLHWEFQRAGSNIVEAFTYNGHREKMRVIGKEDILEPLNRSALRIAKEVADSRPDGEPDLMAGNISNTNIWDPDDKDKQREVYAMFEEMCGWAAEEGADMLIGETFYYTGEALCALEVMKEHNLPRVVTIAMMGENRMRDGDTAVEACQKLEQAGADVVGMNCFRGPQTMMPYLREIRAAVQCPVAALPVPYRTNEEHPTFFNLPDDESCTCPSPHGRTFPTALDPLLMNRYEVRQFARDALDSGINYLGICCGNNPMLTRETAEEAGFTTLASRFSERMENQFMYGNNERIPEHIKSYGSKA
jgi:betaine-homocysteine S-methyltransferase